MTVGNTRVAPGEGEVLEDPSALKYALLIPTSVEGRFSKKVDFLVTRLWIFIKNKNTNLPLSKSDQNDQKSVFNQIMKKNPI